VVWDGDVVEKARKSLYFPCMSGYSVGDSFAADCVHRQPVFGISVSSDSVSKTPEFPGFPRGRYQQRLSLIPIGRAISAGRHPFSFYRFVELKIAVGNPSIWLGDVRQ